MESSIVNASATSRKRRRDEEEEEELEQIFFIIVSVVTMLLGALTWYHDKYFVKEPARNLELERHSFLNRLYRGTETDCIEQLRVSKKAFFKLCRILQEKGQLVKTKNVPIDEAVAMFLHILAHNLKYRVVHFSYCRSMETISRQFKNVLRAIMKVSKEYLKFYEYNLEGSVENKWRWFKNSIGALDGIHIPVTVSAEDRPRYRNRKGDISTNVLGVCGPDLRFIYVLPGWEGSAGDSRVLRDALRRQNCLHIPNGKYFLVDAGYTNGPGFLAPYRGTRYHLNEWIGNTPQNYKELFNLRHASARNVIERSFGVLKKRWSILRTPSFFDIKTQIRIINACFMLHNFIRDEQHSDPILEAQDLELLSIVDNELINQQMERVTNNIGDEVTTIQATEEWTRFRDTLAMNMFATYQIRRNFD
ncbi:protein ALP1-like [Glycine soja]|nr:protein ALP1-like [Glycine soja]XP_028180281.1 protein ALP1-like [Glycine soja]XP_028240496.1 protein ALP1-like [Glycine soja]